MALAIALLRTLSTSTAPRCFMFFGASFHNGKGGINHAAHVYSLEFLILRLIVVRKIGVVKHCGIVY